MLGSLGRRMVIDSLRHLVELPCHSCCTSSPQVNWLRRYLLFVEYQAGVLAILLYFFYIQDVFVARMTSKYGLGISSLSFGPR